MYPFACESAPKAEKVRSRAGCRNGCARAGSFLMQLCHERADGPEHAAAKSTVVEFIAGQPLPSPPACSS